MCSSSIRSRQNFIVRHPLLSVLFCWFLAMLAEFIAFFLSIRGIIPEPLAETIFYIAIPCVAGTASLMLLAYAFLNRFF